MKKSRTKEIWVSVTLAFAMFVAGIWLLVRPTALQQESATSRQAQAEVLGLTANQIARYAPEPGEGDEGDTLLSIADYYITRYTYPTGEFQQTWLTEAAAQASLVPQALPAGVHAPAKTDGRSASLLNLDPSQFTHLGPEPLQSDNCQGCFNYGHVAGRVEVIVSDPISPNIAYFGSDGGGVWKTTNCCTVDTTWTHVTDDPGLLGLVIDDMVIDPNDHNTLYAASGDLNFGSFSFGTAGVFKSTDQGETWQILGSDVFTPGYPRPTSFPQYQAIGKVRVDPRNSDTVVVGTKTGLFFSYNAGISWEGPCITNSFADQRQDITGLIVYDDGSSTTVYAAVGPRGFNTTVQPDLNLNGANAVYRTTMPSSGCPASWDLLNSGWPAGTGGGVPYPTNVIGRIELAMAPSDPDVIYAQVASIVPAGGHLGVWRTDDGGDTWIQASGPTGPGGCSGPGTQSWYNQILAVDPNNPMTVYMGTIDQFRSVNGGVNFTNISCGYNGGEDLHVDQHALAYVDGSSDTLLVGSDGGIYVSLNADAADPNTVLFNQLNDTVSTIEFYSGDITNNFSYAAQPGVNAGAQDNGSSVYVWTSGDPGPALWQLQRGGDGMFARIEQKVGLRWYQESQNGNLFVSTTGPYGTFVSASGSWGGDRLSFIFPYEMDKFDCPGAICDHMIAGTYRVWETVLGGIPGSSWLINSPDLTKNTLGNRSFINQLGYAPTDNSIAIVGTNDGNVQFGFNLGQGVANTASWVNVTDDNTVLPNRPILDVVIHPVTPTIGFAAAGGFDNNTPSTPGHVFQVTCDATCSTYTWENKSGNLPNIPADSIVVNPNIPEQVFVGTDWGLYFTNDVTANPPTWYHFTAGLPPIMIWDMAVDRDGTTLAVFTRSRGAYVWPLPVDYQATIGESALTAVPGTSVVHDIVLTNLGAEDSYSLSLSGWNWPTTLLTSSPITVSEFSSAVIQVQVDVPANASLDDVDMFTVTAVSQATGSVLEGHGSTRAVFAIDFSTSGDDSAAGAVGSVITYTIVVTNEGDATDTFDVEIGPSVWNTSASAASVGPLLPGESGSIEVYVTVGEEESDSVDITFTSDLDGNVSQVVTLTSTSIPVGYFLYLPVVVKP